MIEASQNVGPIQRGDRLYYAHLNRPTPLKPGETVEAGQNIGTVGATGQGPPGTRGEFEPHLHLGWYEGWNFFGEDRTSSLNGAMNPYPLLRHIEQNDEPNPKQRRRSEWEAERLGAVPGFLLGTARTCYSASPATSRAP